MNCIICGSRSSYFFSKDYAGTSFTDLMRDVGVVEFFRCDECGFVLSKTHRDMDRAVWGRLNECFHRHLETGAAGVSINQPPYVEQAMMIKLLITNGLVCKDDILDYAAGYGTLSDILHKYFAVDVMTFDPYVGRNGGSLCVDESALGEYSVVVNSAMFEHVLFREDLDRVNKLVSENGSLIIHTVVCENVPNDPDWFYLRPPVHTAFHTNKSMSILMRQWGYACSVYCPKSKCWVLFREDGSAISSKIEKINAELQSDWFLFKKGFVDYWKGF